MINIRSHLGQMFGVLKNHEDILYRLGYSKSHGQCPVPVILIYESCLVVSFWRYLFGNLLALNELYLLSL